MPTFKPQWRILPGAQRHLWPHLRQAAALGFVLYGGTAIALRLGHRTSVDFDFFSEKPVDRDAIKAAFPFMARTTSLSETSVLDASASRMSLKTAYCRWRLSKT